MKRPDCWVWPVPTPERYPTMKAAIHLTAEDAVRLALAAYYAAVKDLCPPDGQGWLYEDGSLPWSSPRDLHDGFLHHLGERLWAHAAATGHLDGVDDTQQDPTASGAGRSPAVEGQGCPALSPAVGSAPKGSPALDITADGNPLLVCPSGKELPGEKLGDTLNLAGEKLP